jgi:hypothetical protein
MFDLLAPPKGNGPIRYWRYVCVTGRLTLSLADGASELVQPLKTRSYFNGKQSCLAFFQRRIRVCKRARPVRHLMRGVAVRGGKWRIRSRSETGYLREHRFKAALHENATSIMTKSCIIANKQPHLFKKWAKDCKCKCLYITKFTAHLGTQRWQLKQRCLALFL